MTKPLGSKRKSKAEYLTTKEDVMEDLEIDNDTEIKGTEKQINPII